MKPLEVRILKSEQAVRQEALRGVVTLVAVAAMVGIQWWTTTPEPERMLKLRKLGISRCSQRRWHFTPLNLPRRCLCRWPDPTPEQLRQADRIERGIKR